MTLDLTGKHCHVIFLAVLFFIFEKYACKNAGFYRRQMHASLILLFGKTKDLFGKDAARRNTAFLQTLFVENKIRPKKSLWLDMQAPLQL